MLQPVAYQCHVASESHKFMPPHDKMIPINVLFLQVAKARAGHIMAAIRDTPAVTATLGRLLVNPLQPGIQSQPLPNPATLFVHHWLQVFLNMFCTLPTFSVLASDLHCPSVL